MIRSILLFLTLSVSLTAFGQLQFSGGTELEGPTDIFDFEHKFNVQNVTDQEVTAYWQLIKGDDFPDEWSSFLCDNGSCYPDFIRNCPEAKPNVFAPGQSFEWTLHMKPKNTIGESQLTIRVFYPQAEGDSTYVDQIYDIRVGTSNTVEVSLAEMVIYPNPTTDYFGIKADDSVSKIGIYNVVGKQMKMINHRSGQSHNVQDLSKGIYLVRLMDDKGQVMKSMKLSKR